MATLDDLCGGRCPDLCGRVGADQYPRRRYRRPERCHWARTCPRVAPYLETGWPRRTTPMMPRPRNLGYRPGDGIGLHAPSFVAARSLLRTFGQPPWRAGGSAQRRIRASRCAGCAGRARREGRGPRRPGRDGRWPCRRRKASTTVSSSTSGWTDLRKNLRRGCNRLHRHLDTSVASSER